MRLMLLPLLAAPCLAAPDEFRLQWDEMRAAVERANPQSHVRVWIGANGKRRIKARLTGITDEGLSLEKGTKPISVSRDQVHSMKFFPAKVKRRRYRNIAAIMAAPVGFGVFLGSLVVTAFATGGIPEGGYGWGPFLGWTGAGIAVPYIVYDRARVADHRNAVRIVLQP